MVSKYRRITFICFEYSPVNVFVFFRWQICFFFFSSRGSFLFPPAAILIFLLFFAGFRVTCGDRPICDANYQHCQCQVNQRPNSERNDAIMIQSTKNAVFPKTRLRTSLFVNKHKEAAGFYQLLQCLFTKKNGY